MTKHEIYKLIAAIVTALEECGTDAAESTFYLALGMDLRKWESIRDLMVASDVIAVDGYRVSLTAKGRDLARDCSSLVTARR